MKENGKASTDEFLKLDFLYKTIKNKSNIIQYISVQETAGDINLS